MRGEIPGWWLVALVSGAVAGSCGTAPFVCESDAGCEGLSEAQCEPVGYCSVPDPECRSGRRYAADSGPLSDRCVPEEGSTGAQEDSSTTDGGSSTDPALDDSGTSADATSTTGTPPLSPCDGAAPVLLDPFDQPTIDPGWWNQYVDGDISFAPEAGELVATVGELVSDRDSAYSGIASIPSLPPVGSVGVRLIEMPDAELPAEAYVALGDGEVAVGFDVYEGYIGSFENVDSYDSRVTEPFDPEAHRWVRMTYDDGIGLLQWETSPDGQEWSTLDVEDEIPVGWVSSAFLEVGVGVWSGPLASQTFAVMDDAFICEGVEP